MRILITGANGQLGTELQRVLNRHTLILCTWPEFDLLDPSAERQVLDAHPEVIIHAAAYTDVEGAESEPDAAMAVNANGTELMACAAAQCGARLLYLSTDYVFDGAKGSPYDETDEPNPLNAYGRSKLEGERKALARCANTLVIRTSWLYSARGKNFVSTILRRAAEQSDLFVVADQYGSPTLAGDLAAAISRVLDVELRGVAHAAGAGSCTWYEFACTIVALAGREAKVHPITSAEGRRAALRPAFTVLGNRILAERGIQLPHWKDALARFLAQTRSPSAVNP